MEELKVSEQGVSLCCCLRRSVNWSWQKGTVNRVADAVLLYCQWVDSWTPKHGLETGGATVLRLWIQNFKTKVILIFGGAYGTRLHTLKFHVSDDTVTDWERFRSLEELDASSFDHYNLQIEKAYRVASCQSKTRMALTVTGILQVIVEHVGRDLMKPKFQTLSQMEDALRDGAHLQQEGNKSKIPVLVERFQNSADKACSCTSVERVAHLYPVDILHYLISMVGDGVKKSWMGRQGRTWKASDFEFRLWIWKIVPTFEYYDDGDCFILEKTLTKERYIGYFRRKCCLQTTSKNKVWCFNGLVERMETGCC